MRAAFSRTQAALPLTSRLDHQVSNLFFQLQKEPLSPKNTWIILPFYSYVVYLKMIMMSKKLQSITLDLNNNKLICYLAKKKKRKKVLFFVVSPWLTL